MQRDGAAVAADEGMLERVCKQLIDDKSRRHGHVQRDGIGIHLQVESDAFRCMGAHGSGGDFAQIDSEIYFLCVSVRERAV